MHALPYALPSDDQGRKEERYSVMPGANPGLMITSPSSSQSCLTACLRPCRTPRSPTTTS
jgi:hypothetical protein